MGKSKKLLQWGDVQNWTSPFFPEENHINTSLRIYTDVYDIALSRHIFPDNVTVSEKQFMSAFFLFSQHRSSAVQHNAAVAGRFDYLIVLQQFDTLLGWTEQYHETLQDQ